MLIRLASLEPGAVFTVLMTLVVLAGSVFPWLALGVTGTSVDQLYSLHDITADPDEIDPDEVAGDARVGHEILLAVSATVGTPARAPRPLRGRVAASTAPSSRRSAAWPSCSAPASTAPAPRCSPD